LRFGNLTWTPGQPAEAGAEGGAEAAAAVAPAPGMKFKKTFVESIF
tara:strand:- start:1145 stop:1282 length:138 start_codon:yes stop_codon:yes gene_type:complete